jgi:hypothetical protein
MVNSFIGNSIQICRKFKFVGNSNSNRSNTLLLNNNPKDEAKEHVSPTNTKETLWLQTCLPLHSSHGPCRPGAAAF